MKLSGFLVLCPMLTVSAFAQSIEIGAPSTESRVRAGENITVEVDRPDTLTGSIEVAIVIGFVKCGSGPCPSPMDRIGTILYNGGYHPKFHNSPGPRLPYQNFTVTIPAVSPGTAQINVIHFSLVGAGPFPLSQSRNVTVTVE
ncbi:hypothetical protein FB451DRAFT_1187266 [Mycena latifolia]|nr:hypothetical protein FB451DRAFT_1187266 [Mycena latifolia]